MMACSVRSSCWCPARVFRMADVTPPNHWAYVQFPAALLLIFAWMFFAVARQPVGNKGLIVYGILLKAAYCGITFWYWSADGHSRHVEAVRGHRSGHGGPVRVVVPRALGSRGSIGPETASLFPPGEPPHSKGIAISKLRKRLIQDMRLAGLVEGTQDQCLRSVRQLAAY